MSFYKHAIFLFMLLLSQALLASDMFVSYGDFLSLPNQEQKKVVVMVQEFVLEYERLQSIGIKQSLKKKKRYQVYKKILEFISISSAHANTLNHPNRCLYAGHLSTFESGLCEVPSSAEPRNDTSRSYLFYNGASKTFQRHRGGQGPCRYPSHAVCSPEVFGKIENTPICIEKRTDKGENASLQCGQAVAEIQKAAEENRPLNTTGNHIPFNGSPSEIYAELLNSVVEQMTSNSGSDAAQILEMMADVCLCGKDADIVAGQPGSQYFSSSPTSSDNFENSYADFAKTMFGNRTCVGLLLQMDNLNQFYSSGSCLVERRVGQSQQFSDWLQVQRNISEFLNASTGSGVQSSTADYARNQTIERNNGSQSREAFIERIRNNNRSYEALANQRYEAAVQRGMCPVNIEAIRIDLRQTGPGTAIATVTADRDLTEDELRETEVDGGLVTDVDAGDQTIEIDTTGGGDTLGVTQPGDGVDSPDLSVTSTGPETTSTPDDTGDGTQDDTPTGREVTACLNSACDSIPLNSNGVELNISLLDGNKLKFEYECSTCGPDTEYTVPTLQEGEHNGFSIVGEITPEVCEGEASQSIFCANFNPPTEDTTLTFTGGTDGENPIEAQGDIEIPASQDSNLNIVSEGTFIHTVGDQIFLGVTISGATLNGEDDEQIDLLEGDENFTKLQGTISDSEESITPQRVSGTSGSIFFPISSLMGGTLDIIYDGDPEATAEINVSAIGANCILENEGEGYKVTVDMQGVEINSQGGNMTVVNFPESATLRFSITGAEEDGSEDITENRALTLNQSNELEANYSLAEGQTLDGIDLENALTSLNGPTLNIQGIRPQDAGLNCSKAIVVTAQINPEVEDADTDSETEEEATVTSTNFESCSIELSDQALVASQTSQSFRMRATASGNEEVAEGEDEPEYTVRIYDLSKRARRETASDDDDDDRTVIGPRRDRTEDGEEEDDETEVVEDEALRDALNETRNRRLLSGTGTMIAPVEGRRVPLRLVAYRDGVPCGTMTAEIPQRPADNSNPMQGDTTRRVAPQGPPKFHMNQL